MRTTYKLDNKRISKKALSELIGANLVTSITRNACVILPKTQTSKTASGSATEC